MGMKKATPEERLLNLIKKTGSAPVPQELSAPLPQVSKIQGLPPSPPVRIKFSRFFSIFLLILVFSGLLFWSVQRNFLSINNFSSLAFFQSSGKTLTPPQEPMPVTQALERAPSAVNEKPSLTKVSPPVGYVLTGVIIGEPLSAIIRNTQTEEMLTLELGDTLLQYSLTRIEKGKITFEDSQNTFTMTL